MTFADIVKLSDPECYLLYCKVIAQSEKIPEPANRRSSQQLHAHNLRVNEVVDLHLGVIAVQLEAQKTTLEDMLATAERLGPAQPRGGTAMYLACRALRYTRSTAETTGKPTGQKV